MAQRSRTSTLLLSRSEVEGLVTMRESIEALRTTYREHNAGRTKVYPRYHIPFDQYNGAIGYMEAAVDSFGSSATKIVGNYNDNPKEGMPRILALIVLNRIENGAPAVVMDGNFLTMLRTGAVAALATEYLAQKDVKVAGVFGAGVQGKGQLMGLMESRKPAKVLFYDVSEHAARSLAAEAGKEYGVDCVIADSPDSFRQCDLIACATPSKTPLVTAELLHDGLHVNSVGIGAGLNDKQEVDFAILRSLKLVVEDRKAAKEETLRGAFDRELVGDSDIYATLGELVAGDKPGRTGEEKTAFIAGGMAIQDVAVAKLAYDKAISNGVGQWIDFFK